MSRLITRQRLTTWSLVGFLSLGLGGCQSALTFFNRPPPSVAVRTADSHLPVVRDRCSHHGSDTSDAATGDCPPVGNPPTGQAGVLDNRAGLLAHKPYVQIASLASRSAVARPTAIRTGPVSEPVSLPPEPLPGAPATAERPSVRLTQGVPFKIRSADARWLTALTDRFTVQLISTTRPETIPAWLEQINLPRQQVHILPSLQDPQGRWYYAAVWGDFASPAAARAALARSLPDLSLSDVWIRPVRGLQHPLCNVSTGSAIAGEKGPGCPANLARTLS